jgi:hypothetical protein
MMKLQYTYSRGLAALLRDYPNRSELDWHLLIEVFQNGPYAFFSGSTGDNFSGRGITLTIIDVRDMRQQLCDALSYRAAMPAQP